jgi:hypothetical protein
MIHLPDTPATQAFLEYIGGWLDQSAPAQEAPRASPPVVRSLEATAPKIQRKRKRAR